MSRILAALHAAPLRGKYPVPDELKMDVAWFVLFATSFNGTVLLPDNEKSHWTIECDSSLTGSGAFSKTHYFAIKYTRALTNKNYNIAQLEAINLVVDLNSLAPPEPQNYVININTDNMTSVNWCGA